MRRTLTAAALVLLGAIVAAPFACHADPRTGRTSVDWMVLARELRLSADDLEHAAKIADDPQLASDLTSLAELARHASDAVEGAGEGPAPIVAVRAALRAAERLAEESDNTDAQLAVFTASAILRRLEAYLPAAAPLPGPE